ncbi:hypothetical protein CC86DRAFT_372402 [Ophiobolus disseminans]|uniref:SnoaL-like domain-containing protein n=1 Tax=Ophiobolus disseminans TaxID=1469910 RepID=A0A6A6ZQV9_9PLEO|nr:hypothetical protein CC86DRAFT_372402 [Ophiobolus disseminans]
MTSHSRATQLTSLNLSAIFSERHIPTRLATIASLWVSSGDALFVDPLGVFKTHDAISGMVDRILSMGSERDEFFELSEVECLQHDDESDTWVTRVKWGVGASREDVKLVGWDVLTIVGGRIKACYTFLEK